MISSLENALDLFRKWKDESARVRVGFGGVTGFKEIRVHVVGFVKVVDPAGMVEISGNKSEIHLDLRECRFKYAEPKEPPGDLLLADIADLDSILHIDFPTGEMCIVFAFRED